MKRIVAGKRAVTETLRANAKDISVIYIDPRETGSHSDIRAEAEKRDVRVEEKSAKELEALAEGVLHQGVIAIGGEFSYLDLDTLLKKIPERPILIALDEITDPHNFGAIVRSAVAFGADGIITLKQRAAPVTPVVVRSSAGATEHAKIARVVNLATTLKQFSDDGYDVIGLDAEGSRDVVDFVPSPLGTVLVVGAEGRGLRRLTRERCTELLRISMNGPIASLNASVAAGIAISSITRARSKTS